MAVREEVEVLKEQISELLDANEKLRKENSMLRKEKGSSNPASSQILPHVSKFRPSSQINMVWYEFSVFLFLFTLAIMELCTV